MLSQALIILTFSPGDGVAVIRVSKGVRGSSISSERAESNCLISSSVEKGLERKERAFVF
jgi:hypothetical protein